jgi:predicted nuclease with TOPRIM domain
MTTELLGVAMTAFAGIISTWVKLNNDMTKIQARLDNVEKNETRVSEKLDQLMDMVTELKVLMAKSKVG